MPDNDLKNRFDYHKPSTQDVVEAHEHIRNKCGELAEVLLHLVPTGRELALAHTKLEEAMMWANAGIARNQSVAGHLAEEFFKD